MEKEKSFSFAVFKLKHFKLSKSVPWLTLGMLNWRVLENPVKLHIINKRISGLCGFLK